MEPNSRKISGQGKNKKNEICNSFGRQFTEGVYSVIHDCQQTTLNAIQENKSNFSLHI